MRQKTKNSAHRIMAVLACALLAAGTACAQVSDLSGNYKTVVENGVRKIYVTNRSSMALLYDENGNQIVKKLPDILLREVPVDQNGKPDGIETFYDTSELAPGHPVIITKSWKHGVEDGDTIEYYNYSGDDIKSVTPYVNGAIEGDVVTFDRNGDKETLTPYRDGKVQGTRLTYYPGGGEAVEQAVHYDNDIRNGASKSYFEDGTTLKSVENYKKGVPDGFWTEYNRDSFVVEETDFSDGHLASVKNYKGDGSRIVLHETEYITHDDGRRTSVEKFYYPDGFPKEIIPLGTAGFKSGRYTLYWPNGNIHIQADYDFGTLDGDYGEMTKEGAPVKSEHYDRGKLDGKSTYWHIDYKEEITFRQGKREGDSLYYNRYTGGSAGPPAKITPYKNDLIDGVVQTYSNFGFEAPTDADLETLSRRKPYLVKEETYAKGKLNGISKFYERRQWGAQSDKKPFMYKTEMYKDGLLDGDTVLYGANKSKTVIPYANNLIDGTRKEYDADGVLISEVPCKAGEFQGTAKYYGSDGKLVRSVGYDKSAFHGNQVYYFKNGNPMKIEPYEHGLLNGIVVEYNINGAILKQTSFEKGVELEDNS